MSDQPHRTAEKQLRLAVIVTEFGAAANVGGNPETTVRLFDLPQDIADYINANRGQWSSVQLAIEVKK